MYYDQLYQMPFFKSIKTPAVYYLLSIAVDKFDHCHRDGPLSRQRLCFSMHLSPQIMNNNHMIFVTLLRAAEVVDIGP